MNKYVYRCKVGLLIVMLSFGVFANENTSSIIISGSNHLELIIKNGDQCTMRINNISLTITKNQDYDSTTFDDCLEAKSAVDDFLDTLFEYGNIHPNNNKVIINSTKNTCSIKLNNEPKVTYHHNKDTIDYMGCSILETSMNMLIELLQ